MNTCLCFVWTSDDVCTLMRPKVVSDSVLMTAMRAQDDSISACTSVGNGHFVHGSAASKSTNSAQTTPVPSPTSHVNLSDEKGSWGQAHLEAAPQDPATRGTPVLLELDSSSGKAKPVFTIDLLIQAAAGAQQSTESPIPSVSSCSPLKAGSGSPTEVVPQAPLSALVKGMAGSETTTLNHEMASVHPQGFQCVSDAALGASLTPLKRESGNFRSLLEVKRNQAESDTNSFHSAYADSPPILSPLFVVSSGPPRESAFDVLPTHSSGPLPHVGTVASSTKVPKMSSSDMSRRPFTDTTEAFPRAYQEAEVSTAGACVGPTTNAVQNFQDAPEAADSPLTSIPQHRCTSPRSAGLASFLPASTTDGMHIFHDAPEAVNHPHVTGERQPSIQSPATAGSTPLNPPQGLHWFEDAVEAFSNGSPTTMAEMQSCTAIRSEDFEGTAVASIENTGRSMAPFGALAGVCTANTQLPAVHEIPWRISSNCPEDHIPSNPVEPAVTISGISPEVQSNLILQQVVPSSATEVMGARPHLGSNGSAGSGDSLGDRTTSGPAGEDDVFAGLVSDDFNARIQAAFHRLESHQRLKS